MINIKKDKVYSWETYKNILIGSLHEQELDYYHGQFSIKFIDDGKNLNDF